MVALSARRLVWAAIDEISPTTSPMRAVASVRAWTWRAVCPASATAAWASRAEPSTWRPISWTEAPSSSAATATVSTLAEASSAAAATVVDWDAVWVAVAVMAWAVPRSSPEAPAARGHHAGDRGLEALGSSFSAGARRIRRSFGLALAAQALPLDGVVAEDQHGAGHRPDLVAPRRPPGPQPRCASARVPIVARRRAIGATDRREQEASAEEGQHDDETGDGEATRC